MPVMSSKPCQNTDGFNTVTIRKQKVSKWLELCGIITDGCFWHCKECSFGSNAVTSMNRYSDALTYTVLAWSYHTGTQSKSMPYQLQWLPVQERFSTNCAYEACCWVWWYAFRALGRWCSAVGKAPVGLVSHWPCVTLTDFSGLSTYGLNGYERETSTPPMLRRGTVDLPCLQSFDCVGWATGRTPSL